MIGVSSPAGYRFAGDNDNIDHPTMRSSSYEGGGFEQLFAVEPAGLRGLNRLVSKLNVLVGTGGISDFQLGRWRDERHHIHGVLFPSAIELELARLSLSL
ncbi:hypothetical protein [Flaviflagellibacter deserti]|uniref:Uncharacterized protein n=1 Tax=Flaviflagellibacter deserti TaxID=2267266 RepID=A0ABV9YZ13_9HYPH